ncbi:MAG: VWA domain-containing protein [Rhodobiaceae bacterium]|nr:VWA domain-containing protein [Rhodobiaceae bacterium]MCC0057548.1 VWA domain-containing protein [Rhodobiaceae bacterium]
MSDEFDMLDALRGDKVPPAGSKAKAEALDAALAAYDAAQTEKSKGNAAGQRLRSIIPGKGFWSMNNLRIPVGIAAAGVLLVPLSVMLLSTTNLTGMPPRTIDTTAQRIERDEAEARPEARPAPPPVASEAGRMMDAAPPRQEPARQDFGGSLSGARPLPQAEAKMESRERAAAPAALAVQNRAIAPAPVMPSPGYQSGDRFQQFADNGFQSVAEAPVSTFSIDVDTASYSYVRKTLEAGMLPPPDAVRVEELINYFHYDYAVPQSIETPFQTSLGVVPSPWGEGRQIVRIGVQGYEVPAASRPAANLVFLIDTSGSMNAPDKLPLLKRAFGTLLGSLNADDRVSIVTYAGAAGVVLEPTPASERAKIMSAIDNLQPGGSTAGAAGIETAYRLAQSAKADGTINRVLLATDGDFNVGVSSDQELKRLIAAKRAEGIFLSVLGFGTGNLNDQGMQSLAQNGNGAAYYIDSFREAQRVLSAEVGATLVPIAKDVKIQVEFNPAAVAEYRLIGYETRALNREDFNNDKVDAGDVGSGASVTALYEITPVGSKGVLNDPLRYQTAEPQRRSADTSGEIGYVKLRYKPIDSETSRLIETPIGKALIKDSVESADPATRFAVAVAGFGQKLRGNPELDATSYADIRALAQGARGSDPDGYRAEFLSLVDMAASLSGK